MMLLPCNAASSSPFCVRMILKSDGTIPPPPGGPAPEPPAGVTQPDTKSRVANWSAWTNDQQTCEWCHSQFSLTLWWTSALISLCLCVTSDDKQKLYTEIDGPPEMSPARIDKDVVCVHTSTCVLCLLPVWWQMRLAHYCLLLIQHFTSKSKVINLLHKLLEKSQKTQVWCFMMVCGCVCALYIVKNLCLCYSKSSITSWTTSNILSINCRKLQRPLMNSANARNPRRVKRKHLEVRPHDTNFVCVYWWMSLEVCRWCHWCVCFVQRECWLWDLNLRLRMSLSTVCRSSNTPLTCWWGNTLCLCKVMCLEKIFENKISLFVAGEVKAAHSESQRCGSASLSLQSSQTGTRVHDQTCSYFSWFWNVICHWWDVVFVCQVIQTSGGVDLAKSVIVPLLTKEAIDFLHSSGSEDERHLWVTLGDGWTKCRCWRDEMIRHMKQEREKAWTVCLPLSVSG